MAEKKETVMRQMRQWPERMDQLGEMLRAEIEKLPGVEKTEISRSHAFGEGSSFFAKVFLYSNHTPLRFIFMEIDKMVREILGEDEDILFFWEICPYRKIVMNPEKSAWV